MDKSPKPNNENKLIWESREFSILDDSVVIRNEKDPDLSMLRHVGAEPDVKKRTEKTFKDGKPEHGDLLDLEKELGKDIFEKLNKLYDFILNYFKEKGFTEIEKLPKIYLTQYIEKDNLNTTGARIGSDIYMKNNESNNFPLLKQMEFVSIAGHELYHATSKYSYDRHVDFSDDSLSLNNYGASYLTERESDDLASDESHALALEEGLACRFQKIVEKEFETIFTKKDAEMFEKMMQFSFDNTFAEKGIRHIRGEVESAYIDKDGSKNYTLAYNDAYENSLRLANYLAEEIPNFDKLIEKARVQRRTLDLARAIEKRFGVGSYRLITTATTEEAEGLLQKLKNNIQAA